MNMRTIGIAVIVVALVAAFTGIVSAEPEGAALNVTAAASTKAASTVGNDSAEGGYITGLDANAVQSTAKWQGYYGAVTGSIVLEDGSENKMFDWAWNTSKGGEVLATTSGSITWASLFNVTDAERDNLSVGINALWGWETDQTDDADATLNSTGSVIVAGQTISGTIATANGAILPAGHGWKTLVIADNDTVTSQNDYIFVGLICNDQTGINGTTDYQMMVPVTDVPGTAVTYNFYVEMT